MKTSRRLRQSAFTLVEAMVAIGMFGIYAAVSVTALLRMNYNAALSRLRTGASTVAQGQIDLILSDSPFNPKYNQIPPELAIGTINTGTAANPTIAVYTDPSSNISVNGWMTSTIANTNSVTSAAAATAGTTLYVYSANVTVSYQFRGKTYSVTMNTVRASDL